MIWRITGVVLGVVVAGVLIGFYVANWLLSGPPTYDARTSGTTANITIQTVAAVGSQLAPHPDWVSYLIRNPSSGSWERSTIWTVPAHALVHVKILQFDGDSGLRNPFLARPEGLVGSPTLDGKPFQEINPDDASHTFAIPQLGVLVPLAGVPDDAKNQCGYAPCDPTSMAHRTIEFTFRTGKKGKYRWQCFVPCAAGFQFGFGGPMQTIGYMDGFVNVV
ncbi:MAG TPA: hypothetical protein VLU96_08870 [Gaiellaceae bacterium]|nr:hypothetical protein [Gaiellaceae bacterium]